MSAKAAFTVTESVEIPAYIKSKADAGKDW